MAERLDAAQQTGQVCGAQQHGVRGDGEPVPLFTEAGESGVERQGELSVRGRPQDSPVAG